MRFCVWFSLLLSASAAAEDHWVFAKSGPFEAISNAGDRAVREKLLFLEQFRHALGTTLGKPDLKLVFPLRVAVLRSGNDSKDWPAPPALARDAYMLAVSDKAEFTASNLKGLASLLLAQNIARLPTEIEDGLIELFSTLTVEGTHITLGAPGPVSARTRGWARMHLLTVTPEYFGRTRVFLSNLEQGAYADAAYRNAYEKTAAQIEKQLDDYLKAANFGTAAVPGRALSPKDFRVEAVESDRGSAALADVLLAAGSTRAAAAYGALHGAVAAEGLGLIAVTEGKNAEAKRLLASAAESGGTSARAWLELGKLETDRAKAFQDLKKAAELNQRWGEPAYRLSRIEEDAGRKIVLLQKAASLDPRNVDYWRELAQAETTANRFADAQKAWAGAERAAPEAERERIHETRLEVDRQRADFVIAERKREAEERERDIERVKAQSAAEVRAAETAANKKLNPNGAAPPKAVDWWSAATGDAKADGVLQRVDCLGGHARLIIEAAGATVQLLVADPSQVVISGGGEKTLGCGAQRPPRKIVAQYNSRADRKFHTSGDAVSIEFR